MEKRVVKACMVVLAALLLSGCMGLFLGGTAVGVGVVHDRRSTGKIVDDQTIELKLYNRLNEKLPPGNRISITSYNGSVLLTGEAVSARVRRQAEQVVRDFREPEVQRVHNELVIGAPRSLSDQSKDALITTKVKAALFRINNLPDFDPSRVKVVTARGVVYLMGLVRPAESVATAQVASLVGGVRRVVLLFEQI
ncbi:MAG: hypothetical protein CSA09_00590 [Candidatus Contendobacter odensis]|uniref:BON domain-containing protein n=1 Tax=Candidatus Contendibacter odensensis TaxID=1400860 RepID=A0A2G6PGM8_9GAMM|nr:MAG: hypothetical protein CSA09_00590 [Candidatus Contendobacter odensis]